MNALRVEVDFERVDQGDGLSDWIETEKEDDRLDKLDEDTTDLPLVSSNGQTEFRWNSLFGFLNFGNFFLSPLTFFLLLFSLSLYIYLYIYM